MILWSYNLPLDGDTIDMVSSQVKCDSNFDNHFNQYTTYFSSNRPEYVLKDFYIDVINHCNDHLTMSNRLEWDLSYWMQIYPPDSNGHHGAHDHYTGDELYSWVHFLKPVKKAFHFLVNGKKVYPEQQNRGDFIVFPPWALHAVDGNDTNLERAIIAGNVVVKKLITDHKDGSQLTRVCHTINRDIRLWENINERK